MPVVAGLMLRLRQIYEDWNAEYHSIRFRLPTLLKNLMPVDLAGIPMHALGVQVGLVLGLLGFVPGVSELITLVDFTLHMWERRDDLVWGLFEFVVGPLVAPFLLVMEEIPALTAFDRGEIVGTLLAIFIALVVVVIVAILTGGPSAPILAERFAAGARNAGRALRRAFVRLMLAARLDVRLLRIPIRAMRRLSRRT